ncbi:hypothetical protein PPACK8108_LOCUS5626 [Phakopsora pachyrhizi]|uniref:Glycosyltransferase family 28 N-terminal domain-containing protein n=1 Tax=Phakopsora pachyrhizi TaxID=170000 RepID=A0AAV0ARB0_PHAPC|nr:hypothetical protein PPACK8108_LOCUS5626 [Phakopsora pachyrhizi]
MFESTSSSFLTFKPKESPHITSLTKGSIGDAQPYITLFQTLKKDGNTCRIASHGEYKPWIEGYGIEFVEIGGSPAELIKICVDNGMFTLALIREGLRKLWGWLDNLLVSFYKACKAIDLLIESPLTMSGIHIAEVLEILYTVFDQVFWSAISGQINRWRKQTLGLRLTSYEKLESHKVPFLYNFSQTIVPSPLDWFEWVHITGYWLLDKGMTSDGKDGEKSAICSKESVGDAEDSVDGPIKEERKKWVPEPGLVQFIEKANNESKKNVYIGFGSIVVPNPEEMTRTIVEAIKKADVYAIVTKEWSDQLKNPSKQPEKTAVDERKNLETAVTDVNGSKTNQKHLEIKDIDHNREAKKSVRGFGVCQIVN